MKKLLSIVLLLAAISGFSQNANNNDRQTRYTSDFRQFYIWNEEKQDYELKDSEYENSIIDIREIHSSSNGYVCISMTDDAKTRMYHGSILGFKNENGEESWSLRSKILKSRLIYNREKKTITYSYESTGERYNKIFIFKLSEDQDFALSNPR